ncbi:hypothetical protein AVEN_257726-1 [Araneus ventricosus]|uniref:Uncharacterized protein n=1 Tax=Araneus ventricosus TaxID=182803 RepID=A0A4Y2LF26_ARAVE|nr:hypothetical protein AVEN_257726-1 [Araneus ventricosus]
MSEVNYIVAVDWKVLPDNYVSPKRVVLLDALTQDQIIILSVEDTLSESEHEWHVPGQYLPSFIEIPISNRCVYRLQMDENPCWEPTILFLGNFS